LLAEIVEFVSAHRPHLIVLLFALLILAIWKPKLRLPAWRPLWRRFPVPTPAEQRLVEAETDLERLRREKERLELTLAKIKARRIEEEIVKRARERLRLMIPKRQLLLDPRRDVVGRPLYYLGASPTINIDEEVERLIEARRLPPIMPRSLVHKLLRWLYFGSSHTLHWWDVRLLPDGKWAVLAVSKPPWKRGRHLRLKPFTKSYVLLTSAQDRIDDIILNRWEVITTGAAVELSATFLGPFPVEEWLEIQKATGWTQPARRRPA